MRKNQLPLVLLAFIALLPSARAATNTWNFTGVPPGDWGTSGNWSPAVLPGPNDEARFFNPGSVSDTTTIDNVVSTNTTVQRLWIGQTNLPNHNLSINAGVTLTIAGTNDNGYGPLGSDPNAGSIDADPDPQRYLSTIYVGTKTTNNSTQIVREDISGAGSLVINNTNNEILIRQFHPTGAAHRAILDLSGLNTFTANLGRIRVGDGEAQPINRSEGQLYLAKTNTITLTGTNYQDNVQLIVGNNDVNQNQSNPSLMVLGGQNRIFVDEVLVGGKKQPGTLRSTNSFSTLSLFLRGSDGVSRVRALRVGDASDQPTSGNGTTGIAFFTDDTCDILADTLTLGKSQSSGTGNGSLSTGTLSLGAGTLDVNTLDMAFRMDNCSSINAATGNLNLSNTTVTVNSLLRMGRMGGGTTPPVANINALASTVTIKSNVTIEGNASINVTNTTLTFVRPAALALNTLVLDGSSLSNNAGSLRVSNTLSIANNGTILGNPSFDMGNTPATTWNVQGASGGGLTVNNSLQGGGTINGNLLQGTGGIVGAGGNGTVGTLNIAGNLTLGPGTLRFDLSNSGLSGNDQITASGTLTLTGTNDVNLSAVSGGFDTVNPYALITSSSLVGGNQNNFRVAGPLAASRYTFAFDTASTPNTVKLIVGGAGGANLTWVGDGSANVWDTTALNWNNGGPNKFFTLDNVTFNDSGSASPAINLSGTLIPGSVTVSNSTKAYGFLGSGSLVANGLLTKSGAASLIVSNNAANSFISVVVVSNGPLIFMNNGQNTFNNGLNIYGGSVVFAGNSANTIVNPGLGNPTEIAAGASLSVINANANAFGGAPIQLDGALSFNQPVDANLDGDISGAGTLTKDGAGKLTITGNNGGLNSVVQINGGTVKAASTTALGGTGVTIANSGTLDLNGRNLGSLAVTVSGTGVGGAGALINTGPPLLTGTAGFGVGAVTLAGNTTVGGTGVWDTDPVKNLGVWGINANSLSTSGNGFSLTKVGPNQFGLSDATVDTALGDITVQQGLLALQGGTSSLGNPANTLTIIAGATVSFFNTSTPWDKKFVLFGDGSTPNFFNYNGANTIVGQITLNGNCVFGAANAARGTPVSLAVNGPIIGTGSLIKAGQQDELILAGTNTYSGSTIVTVGKLVLDGRNIGGGLLTNAAGSTLAGLGTNTGPVVVNGTLSPGDDTTAVGSLGTGPLTLNSSKLVFDVDANSDSVQVSGNLTVTGTIGVQLVPGASLAAGQIVPLIHYTGAMTGNTNQFTLLPLPPGFTANLYSNANTIGIVVAYVPVNKSWRGGNTAGPTLWDITTTNWDNAGSPDRYNSGDFANFDDNGTTNVVSLVGTLTPASLTLNNTAFPYYFGGAGKFSGTMSLTMNGSASVFVTNSGVSDFSGPITINGNAGQLFIGNGSTNGSLGTGPITNMTGITFNKTGTNNVNNNFFDIGVVTNMGGGVFVFGGDNSLADMNFAVETNTTLRTASASALGRNNGTTLIENGGTLDVNGQNLGVKSVTVSGAGVAGNGSIVNSGAAQISALQSIILLTNTTFGGNARWDLRAGNVASLDTGNQPFSITKVGTNQVSLVSVTNVDASLADVDIQQGTFSLQNFTGQLGDPTRTVTVRSNASLSFFALNQFPLNKIISVLNGGIVTNESGTSIISGPISITGKSTFSVAGTSLIISNSNAFTGTSVTNLIKSGAGSLVLVGNSLPSATLLNLAAGTLDLSQSTTPSLTLGAGQTIMGNGVLVGPLTAGVGSTVSPGASAGTLTVAGNIVLGGTNTMEIDRTANTNDLLRATNTVATTITYGGTLKLVTLTGTITATNSFKMFSASNYNGSFSAITPATPGVGLGWNTNTLTADGILRVISTVNSTRTNITFTVNGGTQLNLIWPVDHIGWRLQSQSNALGKGLTTNWTDVPGSTTNSSMNFPVGRTNGSVFFRMIYP
jgi:autotransporter-associated beta strand protein